MEEIERYIKIVQQRRVANQRELECLETESDEHKQLMKELQDLKTETERCKENITRNLNTITAHKHSIEKLVHSSKDISGLPVPHDYAQDMKTMFTDAIEFLNNIRDTYKTLGNIKENSADPLKLIEVVATCTETVGNELNQTRRRITQLEDLKDGITVLQQHILNTSDDTNESIDSTIGESTDSESTVK